MKKELTSILEGFDFESISDLSHSLLPSMKYNTWIMTVLFSFLTSCINQIFGLDVMAITALLIVMLVELYSGIYASHINKVPFSSKRLSRFTLKFACYLVLIAVPHLFGESYRQNNNSTGAIVFEGLHVFLVTQIVLENIISVLENIAVIQGKPKAYWIDKLKEKFTL